MLTIVDSYLSTVLNRCINLNLRLNNLFIKKKTKVGINIHKNINILFIDYTSFQKNNNTIISKNGKKIYIN